MKLYAGASIHLQTSALMVAPLKGIQRVYYRDYIAVYRDMQGLGFPKLWGLFYGASTLSIVVLGAHEGDRHCFKHSLMNDTTLILNPKCYLKPLCLKPSVLERDLHAVPKLETINPVHNETFELFAANLRTPVYM